MYANAQLAPIGRLTLGIRFDNGRPVAHVADETGIWHPTAYKWWRRWREGGELGLTLPEMVFRPARSLPDERAPGWGIGR